MTNYPRDEFDRVPEFSNRSGSHRANGWAAAVAGGGVRPSLRWLMVFGVVALLVGVFSFTALPKLMGNGSGKTPAPVAASSNTPTATESTGTDPAKESSAGASETTETSADPSQSDDPFASETPGETPASPSESESELSGEVDFSIPVGVYNAANTVGLAGTARTTLVNAGFSSVDASNWAKKVKSSVVYYKAPASRASAEKAASELGIATVFQTSNIPGAIAVVIGSDWR